MVVTIVWLPLVLLKTVKEVALVSLFGMVASMVVVVVVVVVVRRAPRRARPPR